MELRRAWVRTLFPFNLRPGCDRTPDDCLSALASGDSAWLGLSEGRDPEKAAHSEYYEEYVPHVQSFLFGAVGMTGCRYLKRNPEQIPPLLTGTAEVWTRNMRPNKAAAHPGQAAGGPSLRGLQLIGVATDDAVWKAPQPFDSPDQRLPLTVSLTADSGVELWISRLGAGLLSISLECQPVEAASGDGDSYFTALLRLNHALATVQQSVWLRPATGEADAPDQNPANSATETTLHLHQFIRDLVRPLWTQGKACLHFDLRGLVYTAIEVARPKQPPTDFQHQLIRKLSHLAQVHPPSHPGEDGASHADALRINDRHICVMSLTGAAHASILPVGDGRTNKSRPTEDDIPALVNEQQGSDRESHESNNEAHPAQPQVSEYDHKRLYRIQMNYFPGFLLAQLQRCCLQRILIESTELANVRKETQRQAGQQQLLEKVLGFGLEGEFVQACWRTTLQEHHELAQRSCEVQATLKTVRQTMADFNRMSTEETARQQRAEAEEAAGYRHEETERAERTMQVLEIFIVTFYSVELAHVLGESFEFGHAPVGFWPFGDTPFIAWSLMGVAIATFVMAAVLVSWKWLKDKGTMWTITSLFIMATTIHAIFLFGNWKWNELHTKNSTTPRQSNVEHVADEPERSAEKRGMH